MRQKLKIYKNTDILRKIKHIDDEEAKQKKKTNRCVEWFETKKR